MNRLNRLTVVIMIALVTAAVTWSLGWWAVVCVALVAGWLLRDVRGVGWTVSLGAALGWALLLAADAAAGRFAVLAHMLTGTLGVPLVGVLVVTLAFPVFLGWSAAVLASAARREVQRRAPSD